MNKNDKQLICFVKHFDVNSQTIKDYNILKNREDDIKKMKKKCETKEEFAETLKRYMMYRFWSKSEGELIVNITDDGRVILLPWCGCREPEESMIDVTDDGSFDWRGLAEHHISKQIYKNEAKIDVWDQLCYGGRFDEIATYLWTTRLRYERDNSKFH